MSDDLVSHSKFLSYVLRHRPDSIGLELDDHGWADVPDLLERMRARGRACDMEMLLRVVRVNDKQRFLFNADESKIRANQGHSIAIDLGLAPKAPPEQLFHGTATRFLESIRGQGLNRRNRQHVHLSVDRETAIKVGLRHGTPALLVVSSRKMAGDGHVFYLSENGVWLTEEVPLRYLEFPDA